MTSDMRTLTSAKKEIKSGDVKNEAGMHVRIFFLHGITPAKELQFSKRAKSAGHDGECDSSIPSLSLSCIAKALTSRKLASTRAKQCRPVLRQPSCRYVLAAPRCFRPLIPTRYICGVAFFREPVKTRKTRAMNLRTA